MKISTLQKEELEFLRKGIIEKYKPIHKQVHGKDFLPNAYKPTYATLVREMENVLKHKFGDNYKNRGEALVSNGLLRKLLYETLIKEEECFSVAFINACYWYITEGEMDRITYQ